LLEQSESIASARNFAPVDGIDEEAATGTSSGALLCYLQKYGRLPQQDMYRIEQGEAMGCLSYIYGTFVDNIVWVGGNAEVAQQTALAA
jgi:predicted PhzF superfamily epimerase YddE/YHI9